MDGGSHPVDQFDAGARDSDLDVAGIRQPPREVAAGDHEIALGQVLDVHHAPHQCQPIGGKGENGADENPVQQQLHVQERCLEKQADVVEHRVIPCYDIPAVAFLMQHRPRPEAEAVLARSC